jgi:predicted Zn-dependent peptidase
VERIKEVIRSERLENGLTVLTDRMDGVRSATIGFFFRVGARHEPAAFSGITHFIEHCVFKGSRSRSARELAAEQDRLGGNLDAFTTHEETGFVIKVVDDQFDRAFELLADMTGRPRFDANDLANERRVIIEEIKMNEDSPDEVLSDIFHREFFPGHPLGLPITGTPETLAVLDAAVTADFHRRAFVPANLVIAAAGNVDHDRLVALARASSFGSASEPRETLELELRTPTVAAPLVTESRPDLEQAHLLVAAPAVSARDPRRYAADLLANVLGGGNSSRLWQRVREERGLAYSVGASTALFLDCGFLAVSAATSPEHVGEVASIIVEELGSVVRDGVKGDELDLMKHQARASILLSLEDSASRAGALAQSEMVHGRQIPLGETLANLQAVTVEDLQRLAFEYFRPEQIAIVALGDLGDLAFTRNDLTVGVSQAA